MVASKNIRSGEEVTISYGKRNNDDLLQYFGFVEEKNSYDRYVISNRFSDGKNIFVTKMPIDCWNLVNIFSLLGIKEKRELTMLSPEQLKVLRDILGEELKEYDNRVSSFYDNEIKFIGNERLISEFLGAKREVLTAALERLNK